MASLADDYRQSGVLQANPSGPGRYRRKIDGSEYVTDIVRDVANRIVGRFGLKSCAIDPYLGWIVSYIEPGGFVKPHIDRHAHYQNSSDKHLRCNVLVQGDDPSAWPVVGDTALQVAERGLWAFYASHLPHGTLPLMADTPRIVYQFGFSVPKAFELTHQVVKT